MTQISPQPNSSSPQPIQWFQKIPASPEQISAEKDNIALLAQADLLLLITQLFTLPSTDTQRLLETEVPDLQELLHSSHLPEPEHLAEIFQQIRQQAHTLNLDTWREEYNRLFEASVACPINESGFIRRDKGTILADIAGFYRAFGLDISQQAGEKADHLNGELEFVAILLIILAQSQELETTRITHEALSAFSFDHLGEWLPAFCERLTQMTLLPIYQQLAQLLQSTWVGIVAINQLPQPEADEKELSEEDGTPYECGMVDKPENNE